MGFYQQAEEKLRMDFSRITGQKEAAMKTPVRDALLCFAKQEEEFAQAIAQGGSFRDCMAEVARGVGGSISDLEAFEKATRFYFPGSRVRFEMRVDLAGDADKAGQAAESERTKPRAGMVLDLSDFF